MVLKNDLNKFTYTNFTKDSCFVKESNLLIDLTGHLIELSLFIVRLFVSSVTIINIMFCLILKRQDNCQRPRQFIWNHHYLIYFFVVALPKPIWSYLAKHGSEIKKNQACYLLQYNVRNYAYVCSLVRHKLIKKFISSANP